MGQNAGKPLQNVKNPTPLKGVGLTTPDRSAPDGAKAARSGKCWSPGPDHGPTSASSVNAHRHFANIFHSSDRWVQLLADDAPRGHGSWDNDLGLHSDEKSSSL